MCTLPWKFLFYTKNNKSSVEHLHKEETKRQMEEEEPIEKKEEEEEQGYAWGTWPSSQHIN